MVEAETSQSGEQSEPERVDSPEKQRILEELGGVYDRLQDQEFLRDIATQRLEEEVSPMIDYLFEPGDSFGFEQIIRVDAPHPFEVDTVGVWRSLEEERRQELVNSIGGFFGVDLSDPESKSYKDAVKKKQEEEGVEGAPSEGLVIVTVLETNNPAIDIQVKEYQDPELGRQYSLVRAAEEEE